jgi:8-oxo-dGTP pyrophosphatase MutT (NUDIX family)
VASIPRVAARVLLVDPGGAFLLIKACDPYLPDGPTWWHVPGGGLDPGETVEQAARREVAEEVGLGLLDVGRCRGTRRIEFTFGGRDYVQYESFFLVRLPERVEVDSSAWSDVEQRSMLDWRWWTRDELRSTQETVYPSTLGAWLDAWTASETRSRIRSLDGLQSACRSGGIGLRWRAARLRSRLSRVPGLPRRRQKSSTVRAESSTTRPPTSA